MNIAKIIRGNEELDNTIKNIIKNGIEGKDDIIDMLNNMMREGNETIAKLVDMKTQRNEDEHRRSLWGGPATSGQAANSPTELDCHKNKDEQNG